MKLVIHHGPNAGTSYRLGEGRNVAGRAPDCELVLPSKRVSRHHCAFHVRGDICVVEDLGSANGILINGHSMPTCRLEEGTQVQIGDILLVFTRTQELPVEDPDSRPTVVSTKSIDELLAEQVDDVFSEPEHTAPSLAPGDEEEPSLSLDASEDFGGFGRAAKGDGFGRPSQGGFGGPPQRGFGGPSQGGFGGPSQGGFVGSESITPAAQEVSSGFGGPAFGDPAPFGAGGFGDAGDDGPDSGAPPPVDVPEIGSAAFGGPEASPEPTRTVTRAVPDPKPKGGLPWAARLGGALLLASLVVLCGPIGGVFPLLSSSSSALEEMAVQRGAALAEGLGHRNARALAERKELDLDLSPAEGEPAIKDALLVDTRGDVLAPSNRTKESLKGNPLFARAIELRDTTWGEDGDLIGIIAPVRAEAVEGGPSRSVVGYAYLRYDASGAAAAVGRPWLRGVVSLILVFGAAGGLFAAVWRLAVKPVMTVREETELAIRGHVSLVESPSRWTQLEDLAHTINRALDRAQGKAPASDPRLSAVVTAATTPVFVLNEAAQVTETNALAARWLGKGVEDLIGSSFIDAVPDPAARDTLSGMLRALGEGKGPTQAAPLQVSGHPLTVSITGQSAGGRLRFAVVVIS